MAIFSVHVMELQHLILDHTADSHTPGGKMNSILFLIATDGTEDLSLV